MTTGRFTVRESKPADLVLSNPEAEKKVLGFYMTSHPLTRHAGLLQALATHRVADLLPRPLDRPERVASDVEEHAEARRTGRAGWERSCHTTMTGVRPTLFHPHPGGEVSPRRR